MSLKTQPQKKQPLKKKCSKCTFFGAATTANFAPDPSGKFGLRGECRSCRRAHDARGARARRARRKDLYTIKMQQAYSKIVGDTSLHALPSAAIKNLPIKVEQPQKDGTVKTVVLLPDVHVPEHDPFVWDAVVQWITDHQPDEIVILGDFLELKSCSQHGGEVDMPSLEADFAAGRKAIKELRTAAPKAKITYMEGNHETRLFRFLVAKMPAALDSLSVPAGLRLEEQGIQYVSEMNQPIERGNLDIIHGHQITPRGLLPKHHAAKLTDTWGAPGRTVVIGHSHRQQVYVKPGGKRGNQTGVALGTMRLMDPTWMHGNQPGWSHQFAVAYVRPGGVTDLLPITLTNGGFVYPGKNGRLTFYVGQRSH